MTFDSATHLVVLPKGTCCHRAADWLQRDRKFRGKLTEVTSFYEGRRLLEEKPSISASLLIPDIAEINPILTEAPGWDWVYSFALANPPLFLAKSKKPVTPSLRGRCFTIPALRPLLEGDTQFQQQSFPSGFQCADSTSTFAAAEATAEGGAGYCVTNKECLDRFQLIPVFQLKQMKVIWKIFTFKPID